MPDAEAGDLVPPVRVAPDPVFTARITHLMEVGIRANG